MKFSAVALLGLIAAPAKTLAADDLECTHGKLYVVDDSTSDVHVIDVSNGNLQNLTVETTVALPAVAAGQLAYYGVAGDPLLVQFRGTEASGFMDSFVRVINTGFSVDEHGDHGHIEYTAPSIVENALVDDCEVPIHQVRHDNKIAIFCDGVFDHDPPLNATVHVIDETKLGSTTESAIIQSVVLEGAHHGVAIPVDDDHLLHSLALDDRINRVPDASALPSTFQVVDMDGNIIEELTDTSDPNAHCSGFHGSASVDNTHLLGCDDIHGGIVRVVYNPTTESYTSRALLYPDGPSFDGARIGSFAYHKKNDFMVGAYSVREGTEFHLAAISDADTAISADNLLTLPNGARQCAYQFEVGAGEHLLVFMPNGVLHVFEIENGDFNQVMQKEVVPGMTACSEAAFTAGIGQAFVATPSDRTMYGINLEHVEEGEMEVFTSTLPFTPTGMLVSGFSLEAACKGHHDDDDHDGDDMTSATAMQTLSRSVLLIAATMGWLV